MHKITLIPGDGIGPEVTNAMVKVVEAAGAKIEWERVEAGEAVIEKYNTAIPDYVIDSIKKNDEIVDLPNLSIFRIIITNIMGYFIPRFILFPDLNWDDEKEKEVTIQSIIKILKKDN